MAIPATNFSLSTVNINLGNASTATISLDNARVRSLASNFAASGTPFSMSSLASKSGTFISSIDVTVTNSYSYAKQNQQSTGCYITQSANPGLLVKFDLNGTVQFATGISQDTGFVSLYGLCQGKFVSSNLYSVFALSGGGSPPKGVLKLSAAGVPLAAASFNHDFIRGGILVDSSENITFEAPVLIGGQFVLTASSLNSSLNTARWCKYMISNGLFGDLSPLCIDSSNNVYLRAQATSDQFLRIIKVNSFGTQLFQTTIKPTLSNGANAQCTGAAVNSAGLLAVLTRNPGAPETILMVFNASGVLQWLRLIPASVGNSIENNLVVTESGDIYFTLNTGRIFKFNSAGTLQWQRRLTGYAPGYTFDTFIFRGLSVTGDSDGVLSAGLTASGGDEYNFYQYRGFIAVNTDGSGTGTYTVDDNTGDTFSYSVSELVISTPSTTTHPEVTLVDATFPALTAVTFNTVTAPTISVVKVNI